MPVNGFCEYTGSVDESNKKKDRIRVLVPDVDLEDSPEFLCDNLVGDREPEPLEAVLVLEDDSYVEFVRGVCSP